MFNFIKKSTSLAGGDQAGYEEKDGDKEKRKKEKKERKEREKRERIAAGLEEPLRLEEVRRSLKLRGRRKEKEKLPSGITADYTASLFAHLEQDSNYSNYPLITTSGSNSNLSDETNHLSPTLPSGNNWKRDNVLQSDSSETSLNSLNNRNNTNASPKKPPYLPPVPPRPPKRGILKGPRLSNTSSNSLENNGPNDVVDYINGQDSNLLARNTQQNENISYGLHPSKSTSSSDEMQLQNFTKKVIHSPIENQFNNKNNGTTITAQDVDTAKTNGNNYLGLTSTSPSADSLTDTTTNSSFATPPFSTSPVGESQGFHRWSRISNFEDVFLPLPEIKPMQLPKARVLTIPRQKAPRNDFGFSLRRAVIQERVFTGDTKTNIVDSLHNGEAKCNGSNGITSKVIYKAVILAEPGSYPGASETGLLPGDRLLEVNGICVEDKNREEVIDLIKSSQESVTIKVQPIAELCELSRRRTTDGRGDVDLDDSNVRCGTLSRSGSRRFANTQAKSEEQLQCEKEWLKAGHMWLAHRGGFTAVVREGEGDMGRVKVRVIQTGEVLTVDEDDLEKANPLQLERCEDLASLRCLNECGALHVLRSRFAAGLPHSRAGHALLVLGPPRRTAPIYTEKVAAMFRGCRTDDMPPHIFATAQSAHKCMLASRRDRAIVFLGRSGSGKTSALRHCMWYLATAYPTQGTKLTPEKFDASLTTLQAFGSCRTSSNAFASRFVSLFSLDFDGGGALVSASVQTLLPDLRPAAGPLKALHYVLHGCDGRLRRELLLDQGPSTSPNPFVSQEDKAEAPTEFNCLVEALLALGVKEQEQVALWKILAAICHLGWAGVAKSSTPSGVKYQFSSASSAERAARVLGIGADELARAVFTGLAPASSPQAPLVPPRTNFRTPSPSPTDRELTGTEALDAFVTGLYNEVFNMVAALVNRCLSTSARTSASILLLDSPGADNPLCAGHQGGANLPKLLNNYLQERLQAVFHDAMLIQPRERYAQEGITLDDGNDEDWVSETINPGPMVELLDKAPQNTIVRSSQADLRECDRRGLLWLLDEESMYPGSSDDSFLERVMTHYGPPHHAHYLIKKAPHARQFVLQHLQGTNPVLYDVTGWVKASRENTYMKKALTVLQESQNEDISSLVSYSRGCGGASVGWSAASDASTLRRASSIRRTLNTGTAGMKRRSLALQAKFVSDGLVDTLRRCGGRGVSFVCCLLTAHDHTADTAAADQVNVPLLRSQFRGFQLLDAARLYKQGFPEYMPLAEFARRYRLLAHSESDENETGQQKAALSDRQIVDDMLLSLDLDVTSYRLGLTQITCPSSEMKRKKYCTAFHCRNDSSDLSLTFHTLPNDIERRQQWLLSLKREDLLQKDYKKSSYLVCSAHFEESSIEIIKHIKKDALPKLSFNDQSHEGSSSEASVPINIKSDLQILSNILIKKATSSEEAQSSSAEKKDPLCLCKKVLLSSKIKKVTIDTQTEEKTQILKEKQSQTTKSLTIDSSRKRKLEIELRESKFKRRKLEQEIAKIKKELEGKNAPVTCNDPEDEVEKRFKKMINWQNKIKNKYKGNRYEAEYKMFSLNLHYSSPHAYRCLQTVLKLPSKSTMNRFKINIPAKFDNRVLDSLALKIKSLPEAAKYCSICVDEMSLKRNLHYNIKTDEVIGFHNVNGKITPEIASNAFVIMLQGIYCKWKQPIAYALLATSKHYAEIDQWMNEIITKLNSIGIIVKAIVSDQGSNFDKLAKEVKKVTIEKPYFLHNNMKIYYIFDVPHLIKCIRNNLLTSYFIYDGKKISWDYIEQLYKDQKERNLRLIPKLTDAHIQPNNFQRMRVKLAVQTLSRTVSAALHTYIDLGKISEDARPTANFIELINNLFDVLNSSKIKSSYKFQTAFRLNKDQEKVLDDAKEMFASTKAINRKTGKNNTNHIKSLINFQITIQSIKMIYQDLKNAGFKFLLTRRLNQDSLENFFGSIRQQGGSCTEPTPIQFQRAFSKLFICNMIKISPETNCEMDICDILLKAEDISNKITLTTTSQPQASAVCLGGETDYRMDLPEENTLTYIAGYLFYKCIKQHNCPVINTVLKSVPDLHETNLFTRYKAYNKKSSFYGGLKMPPQEFIRYVQSLETTFVQNFDKVIQRNPGNELLKLFKSISPLTPCICFPVDYLLKLFSRFRIYSTVKFNNRNFKDGKKGIKKYIKVSHL